MVVACCACAERAGVRVGMSISQAKAMLPNGSVHQEPWDGRVLRRALRRLALHALRFAPNVAVDELDGLWLDCAGCTHLHVKGGKGESGGGGGGARAMALAVVQHMARLGFACRAGVAPSMGASWALARFGTDAISVVEVGSLTQALTPLPIAALRLTPEEQHALESVGVTTVAELLVIPRHALAERFGEEVLRRLDQAFGRVPESFDPMRTRPPLRVGRAFAGPTDRAESIALCVQHLLTALSVRLERRSAGCREVLLILRRSDLPPVEITARATSPTRNARHWYTLLRPHLERAQLGFGVEGVELAARGVMTLRHEQASRWIDTGHEAEAAELARLADTLRARLGEGRVVQIRARASFIPERAWRSETALAFDAQNDRAAGVPELDRPTLLLSRPVQIEVVFLFPDGPIGTLRWNGEVRGVVRCRGPERLCGEWWRREHATREYYQVHTEDGAWLWVYRVMDSGRWFLQGEWA